MPIRGYGAIRTEDNLSQLEAALQNNCGDFYGACRECLLSPAFVRKWMQDDPEVKSRIDNANAVGAMQLESAAIQRAVHGWEEPVFYKGDECGAVRKYSDPLLQTLLKKRLPETYADDAGGAKIVNYGQINIMPRANTYEEWLTMQRETEQHVLEDMRGTNGVPIEEAEYEYVLPPPEDDPALSDLL